MRESEPSGSRYEVQDFISFGMDFTFVRWKRVGSQGYNSYGHTVNPLRRAGLAKRRGDGQVAMNVQSVTGGIYEIDLVHRLYRAFLGCGVSRETAPGGLIGTVGAAVERHRLAVKKVVTSS